jgi:hypothetical protein
MKTCTDALGIAGNNSRSSKQKNGTRRPRYRPRYLVPLKTSLGEQNMNKGPATPGAAENESGRAKHENGT